MKALTSGLLILAGATGGFGPGGVPAPGSPGGRVAADTVFVVERGDRLVLENLSGRVHVETWERAEVRIASDTREPVELRVDRGPGSVHVGSRHRKHESRSRSYRVAVPSWLEVEVGGRELDISVSGVEGGLTVWTAEGEVEIAGARGEIRARSMEGTLSLEDISGRVTVEAGDDDVFLTRVEGVVVCKNVDGDLVLEEMDVTGLEASTVEGDVRFTGRMAGGGEYRLVTHDGDIVVGLDEVPDAHVQVSTFDGEFRTEFPATIERFHGGRELRFSLGGGGGQLVLEAFDGDIILRRRP